MKDTKVLLMSVTDQSVVNFIDSFIVLNLAHPKSKRNKGNRVGNFRGCQKNDVFYSLQYLQE